MDALVIYLHSTAPEVFTWRGAVLLLAVGMFALALFTKPQRRQ